MPIPPLGLLVRAHVFNQLTAKVLLAAGHTGKRYKSSCFNAAFNGISNRRDEICEQVCLGRMDLMTFTLRAKRLARLEVMLNNPARGHRNALEQLKSMPIEIADSYSRTLEAARERAANHDPDRATSQLEKLLAPAALRSDARQDLADAFWSGHLSSYASFSLQVKLQATREVPTCASESLRQAMELKATRDIFYHVAQQSPAGTAQEWRPVEKLLFDFASRMQAEAAEKQHTGAVSTTTVATGASPPAAGRIDPAALDAAFSALWRGHALPDYSTFKEVIHNAAGHSLVETHDRPLLTGRSRSVTSILSHIREHAPEMKPDEWSSERFLLDAYASALEAETRDQMKRGPVSSAPSLTRSQRSYSGQPGPDYGLPGTRSGSLVPLAGSLQHLDQASPSPFLRTQSWQGFPSRDDEPAGAPGAYDSDDSQFWSDGESVTDTSVIPSPAGRGHLNMTASEC